MEVAEEIADRVMVKAEPDVEEIYERTFPRVASFVSNMDGTFDDARDIFHDALVVYFELVAEKKLTVKLTEEAYILGIAKHLWYRKYSRSKRFVPLTAAEQQIPVPGDFYPTSEDNRLLEFVEKAGRKCLDLLRAFYYRNESLKKIAGSLGFASEHSAGVQKYKCIEKIRDSIKEKSLSYEDFIE